MLDLDKIVIDKEFEKLLPPLSIDELEQLEDNIKKSGLLDPLIVWQDPESDTNDCILIDGHNRYKILKKNSGIYNPWHSYKFMYEDELPNREAVKLWMLERQLGRRNLSEVEKYEIVQKFKETLVSRAKQNQSLAGKGLTNLSKVNVRKELAEKVGVSEGTYQKLDKVMQSDNEAVKETLREKKISVDAAYQEVKDNISSTDCHSVMTPEELLEKIENEIEEYYLEIEKYRERIIKFEKKYDKKIDEVKLEILRLKNHAKQIKESIDA